eukprot:scaffold2015_cov186-Amphora_coffeaeformis.AAC.1
MGASLHDTKDAKGQHTTYVVAKRSYRPYQKSQLVLLCFNDCAFLFEPVFSIAVLPNPAQLLIAVFWAVPCGVSTRYRFYSDFDASLNSCTFRSRNLMLISFEIEGIVMTT